MKALIYTRVSSDAKQRGRSVAEQEAECRTFCQSNGWDVVDVITDNDRSASRHAKRTRDGWQRVTTAIEGGAVDVLVTWEASRAQRDLGAYTELRALCERTATRWCYSGTVYDFSTREDRFRTGLDALLAEDEAERTRERVKRGMRANAQAGRPHGKIPFGYRRIYDEQTRELVRQEPDPEQAALLVEAAQRVLSGESLTSICADFNGRGAPIPRPRFDANGKRTDAGWQLGQLGRLLRNPIYAGLRVHQGTVVGEGAWPAILERATWDRLQALLSDPARRFVKETPTARLLTGALRCGVCGSPCSYAKQGGFTDGRGHTRKLRLTYTCRAKQHVSRDMNQLDAYVTAVVLQRLAEPDALAVADDEDAATATEARREHDSLKARLAEALTEFLAGHLSASTLAAIEADLQPRIDAAERAARTVGLPSTVADIVGAEDVATAWDKLTTVQKRALIRALCTVTLLPVKRGRRTFDPDGVRIDWKR